jgi:GAF domain-containing protein
MKRRSGGEPAKARRRKSVTLKHRNAPKVTRSRPSSVGDKGKKIALLTRERDEVLEQQTATADVLKVISRSTFDLPKVLNTLLESAARLCEADKGQIVRPTGKDARYYIAASYRMMPEFNEHVKTQTFAPGRDGVIGRVLLEDKSVQIPDVLADPEYTFREHARLGDFRTSLGVPLLREGVPIGLLILQRAAVRPFTDKQIKLVETFADQAVIAIEKARLFEAEQQRTRELSESLEQQTATSDVLRVISNLPTDIQPVFETIGERAEKLCDAEISLVSIVDGELFRLASIHGDTEAGVESARRAYPMRRTDETIIARAIRTRSVCHVADVLSDPLYQLKDTVRASGIRGCLGVPMVRDERVVGAIFVARRQPGLFSDTQVQLLKTFADQAVIAIENVRLFNETKISLEQQTATADVLKIISRSTFDLQTVLLTLVESAARFCHADKACIIREKDGVFYAAEAYGYSHEFLDYMKNIPIKAERGSASGRALVDGRVVHITDAAADPEYTLVEARRLGDYRTILCVPMLREGVPIGLLVLTRSEVQAFTDKQIELVTTYADQAAIAIENARLLRELRERTEQVVKLNEQLEQRVADQVGEIERMSRLRRFLPAQVADLIVASGTEKQLESHRREITALFCDLRGFTGFSESSDPEDVMALLREYHAAIGEIIVKYSGTLERYAGDGVMVVFNDPIPVDNPALQAVQMALEMRGEISELTEKWRQLGHEIGFGIGIAHGYATLGTIGFEGRFDYAAIGTVSNVASRLCDEAKPGEILISPRVLMAVKDAVTVEPVGEFELKGIRRPIAAHNVLAAAPPNP